MHFKSTTSYRDFDNSFGRDSDGTPIPQLYTWDTSKHEQFTQEFQLSGLTGPNDGVAWTSGLFYYDAFDSNQGYVNTFTYTSTFSDHKDEQDLKNYAVFAHFDWDITEKLSMSGGLRYTDDEKVADILRVTGNTAPPGVGLPQYVLIPNATSSRSPRSGRRRSASTISSHRRSWVTRRCRRASAAAASVRGRPTPCKSRHSRPSTSTASRSA